MGTVILALLVACVGLFFLAGAGPGPPGLPDASAKVPGRAATAAGDLLPLASPAGWPRGPIERYDRETLYEKIDGKADAFLPYRLVDLRCAGYADPKAPETWVDVHLFDMGEPLDAFGIYRAQRTGREPSAGLGDESTVAGVAVFLRRGRYYVEILGSGPAAEAEARALAKALGETLPAATAPVSVPAFPAQGLVVVRFDRSSGLGVDAFRDSFLAVYEDGARAVVAEAGSAEEAKAAAEQARSSFTFLGEPSAFEARGRRVIGATGGKDEARRSGLLEALRAMVPTEAR